MFIYIYQRWLDLASSDGADRLTVSQIIESCISHLSILNNRCTQRQRKWVERALEEAINKIIKTDMKAMSKKQIVESSLRLFIL